MKLLAMTGIEEGMNAYIMHDTVVHNLWLSYGEDAVEAAKKLDCKEENLSVVGSFPVGQPIELGKLWPYFGNYPMSEL